MLDFPATWEYRLVSFSSSPTNQAPQALFSSHLFSFLYFHFSPICLNLDRPSASQHQRSRTSIPPNHLHRRIFIPKTRNNPVYHPLFVFKTQA